MHYTDKQGHKQDHHLHEPSLARGNDHVSRGHTRKRVKKRHGMSDAMIKALYG